MNREMHIVAQLLLQRSNLLDQQGRLLKRPVDVEYLVESRGLRIVGSEPDGEFALPPRRKGRIRIDKRQVVVRSDLFDGESKDVEFREVLAHELAHDVLHGGYLDQNTLPFGVLDGLRLRLATLTFSRDRRLEHEREAIYLGALIQVPNHDFRAILGGLADAYTGGRWRFASGRSVSQEAEAAEQYQQEAVQTISTQLGVTDITARVALDYWGASRRPPKDILARCCTS